MGDLYIGITGITSREEGMWLAGMFPARMPYKLMLGVLVSQKTLMGKTSVKYPNRYPPVRAIESIFEDRPQVLNFVHYNSREMDSLSKQLQEVTELSGPLLHGIQMNIPWPDLEQVKRYRDIFPNVKLVLQISEPAIEQCRNDPFQVANRVKEYLQLKLVDYILLDRSGGQGITLDPRQYKLYLYLLQRLESLDVEMVIAGGLAQATLDLVKDIHDEYPRISIDAEGKLRNEEDHLDLGACEKYLRRAYQIFRC